MKKAKNILLVLSAILSFLMTIFLIVVGSIMMLISGAQNRQDIITRLGMNLDEAGMNAFFNMLNLIATVAIVFGVLQLIAGIFSIVAKAKKQYSYYGIAIAIGVLSGLNVPLILGSIFGIISFRNGDELTY